MRLIAFLLAFIIAVPAYAQGIQQTKGNFEDKFRQLDEVLPDPNVYRNASGAPGHQYWQQEADYKITADLDEDARRLSANATITYTNNSPDTLPWIWMQLDQNIYKQDSIAAMTQTFRAPSGNSPARIGLGHLRRQLALAVKRFG